MVQLIMKTASRKSRLWYKKVTLWIYNTYLQHPSFVVMIFAQLCVQQWASKIWRADWSENEWVNMMSLKVWSSSANSCFISSPDRLLQLVQVEIVMDYLFISGAFPLDFN